MAEQNRALMIETYRELLARVRQTLVLGQQRIEAARVESYWDTGFYINEHHRKKGARAEYGREVLVKLARDTGIHVSVYERCARFAEKFPNLKKPADRRELSGNHRQIEKIAPGKTLNWSHYRALLTVEDPKQRFALEAQALEKNWTSEELEKKITHRNGPLRKIEKRELLTPKRGTVGLFQIVEISGALHWDKGFASYELLSEKEKKQLKKGDLVSKTARGLQKSPGAKPAELFTYEADLLKLIDADTFWMRIWLNPPEWRKEKLRLRGIDCPERGIPAGKRAVRFVKEQFEKAEKITITTTKPDKWDRYLSDVFLKMPTGEEIFLNNLLLEKGHARRYDTPKPEDWQE